MHATCRCHVNYRVGRFVRVADGILDRLVHNVHRIEMRGDSMRKNRGKARGVDYVVLLNRSSTPLAFG